MLNLINQIVARAKADRQRIVLPEGTEERTLKAANQILTEDRKSTRLNSSHIEESRMPSSA